MTWRRLLPVALALVALPAFAPDGHAAPRRYGTRGSRGSGEAYELNGYLTLNDFSNSMDLDDDTGVGFRFGYLYNPHHEIEFMLDSVSADDLLFTGESVDLDNLQVAYVFNFSDRNVVPYLTAGLGVVHADHSDPGFDSETNSVLGLGGGVRFFLGRVAYARFCAPITSRGTARSFRRTRTCPTRNSPSASDGASRPAEPRGDAQLM